MRARCTSVLEVIGIATAAVLFAVGVAALFMSFAILTGSAAKGYPYAFGTGLYLSYADEEGECALISFTPCAVEEISAGDVIVYRSAQGMAAGEVLTRSTRYVSLRSEGDRVAAVPESLVLGKAYASDGLAGRILRSVSEARIFGLVGGLATAFYAMFSLIADIAGRGAWKGTLTV